MVGLPSCYYHSAPIVHHLRRNLSKR
jgi:hypothetical protein